MRAVRDIMIESMNDEGDAFSSKYFLSFFVILLSLKISLFILDFHFVTFFISFSFSFWVFS